MGKRGGRANRAPLRARYYLVSGGTRQPIGDEARFQEGGDGGLPEGTAHSPDDLGFTLGDGPVQQAAEIVRFPMQGLQQRAANLLGEFGAKAFNQGQVIIGMA